jgi:hypothetical protein
MRKKGGNINMQEGMPSAYQQGFVGTVLKDLDSNKDVLKPIYDTTATIGIIYNIFFTIIIIIICAFIIYIGFWLKNSNSNKTKNVIGKYTNVKCENEIIEDINKNKKTIVNCTADIIYMVKGVEYKKGYQTNRIVNDNQPVNVSYDPANPDDFTVDNSYYYIGVSMIVIGFITIAIALFWSILSILYKPVAAVSGIGVLGDAIT